MVDLCAFKVSMIYVASSSPPRATQQDLIGGGLSENGPHGFICLVFSPWLVEMFGKD